jgi:adenylate cyclase
VRLVGPVRVDEGDMSRRERTRLLVSLAISAWIGVLLCWAYVTDKLLPVQQISHDLLFRARDAERFQDYPSRFVIVAIDGKSIDRLGWWMGWSRTYYARLIDTLKAADARVIVFDVGFFEAAPGDDELARAIRDAGIVVQPVIGSNRQPSSTGYIKYAPPERPIPELRPGTRDFGSATVIPDDDGAVRQMPMLMQIGDDIVPTLGLAAEMVALLRPIDSNQSPPTLQFAGREIPITDDYQIQVNYVGPPSVPDGRQTFKVVSFADVLDGSVDPSVFADKRVFVGWLGAQGSADDYWTPVSEAGRKMAGVEIHTNVAATVERNLFLVPENRTTTIATVLLLAVVTGLLSARFGVLKTLVAVLALGTGYLLIMSAMFGAGRLLNIVYPVLAVALPYAGTATYSIIFEQRHARFLRGAMGRYLSPSVMEEIVRRPELLRLGGEKRDMTVLFSDIRGFTTFSEQLDPQELVTLLNEYLTAMTDVVYRYDGVLDKYMGDAIMAFWNGPVPQPDHARRACLTALDMLETLHTLHDRWRARGIPRLDMGVGLNSGAMSVGNMGSDTRFDYTVMGDAVNLGSRLEGTNKEYHTNIVISQATLDQVKDEGFVVRVLDLVAVKGKAQPVAVYELIGRPGQFGRLTPELLAIYERGIHLYRAQEFERAAAAFSEVLNAVPHDGPCMMYLERCEELVAAPPPQDWDGVYVMTHK